MEDSALIYRQLPSVTYTGVILAGDTPASSALFAYKDVKEEDIRVAEAEAALFKLLDG